jgi:hypothetical protein
MPMRGTLPLVREPVASRAAPNLAQAFRALISSIDLAVVAAFATVGLFASLRFELAYPLLLASTLGS